MAITISRNVTGGGLSVSQDTTVTGDSTITVNTSVADSVTDQLLTISLDQSLLKGYYIHSTFAITVETNSSSAPTDTIVLVANVPLVHGATTDLYTGLITADVTAIYLTNASGSTATVKMVFEQDATP